MKRWTPGIAGLTLVILCWPAAHAGLRGLRHAARSGAPNAELKLGELYQYGVGQPDHLVHALAWYERAAPKSHRAAELARQLTARLTPAERQQAAAWAKPRLGPP